MKISYQSSEGHTTLDKLTDAEVEAKFTELTSRGFRAFASTNLEQPVGPVKTMDEVHELNPDELYFTAPLQGG